MKKFIGKCLLMIGSQLWQSGGWTGDETYNDLTWFGKLGYQMFYKGGVMLFGSAEAFHEAAEKAASQYEGA